MGNVTISKSSGLQTAANILEHPPGGLSQALNVVVKPGGIIQSRGGIVTTASTTSLPTTGGLPSSIQSIGFYKDAVFLNAPNTSTIAYYSSSAFTQLSPGYAPPTFGGFSPAMRFVESNGNLYFNTSQGVKTMEALGTTSRDAGVPAALDLWFSYPSASGTAVPGNTQVGYRVVWGIRDSNNNVKLGAPSGRAVPTPNSTSYNPNITINIPAGITTSHYYKLYRTDSSASATADPGDECFLCYVGTVTASDITAGYVIRTDTCDSTLLGEPLYSNPKTGAGALSSKFQPPLCMDMCVWNNALWFANTTNAHALSFQLIGCGAPAGLQIGDTVTIAGTTYTATSFPTLPTDFQLTTSASIFDNIKLTSADLVRAVNRNPSSSVYMTYASGVNDAPGLLRAYKRSLTGSQFNVSVSRSSAWQIVSATSDNNALPHGLFFSALAEPEAVPLTNYFFVGSKNRKIIRIIPLKDKMLVYKEDGLFIVSGAGGQYRVDLLDGTVLTLPAFGESVASVSNYIYSYSNQGVVRATSAGVEIISTPIANQLDLGAVTARGFSCETSRLYILSGVTQYGMAVFNVDSHAWTTWTYVYAPGIAVGATNPATGQLLFAYVDGLTSSAAVGFATYQDVNYGTNGLRPYDGSRFVSPVTNNANGTLTYTDTGAIPKIEVGDVVTDTDHSVWGVVDSVAVVGSSRTLTMRNVTGTYTQSAALVYKGFAVGIEWLPESAGAPGALKQFRDVTLHFGRCNLMAFSVYFTTDLDTSTSTSAYLKTPDASIVLFTGGDVGGPNNRKLLVAQDKQRGGYLTVGFAALEAMSYFEVCGLTIGAEADSDANSRY